MTDVAVLTSSPAKVHASAELLSRSGLSHHVKQTKLRGFPWVGSAARREQLMVPDHLLDQARTLLQESHSTKFDADCAVWGDKLSRYFVIVISAFGMALCLLGLMWGNPYALIGVIICGALIVASLWRRNRESDV